MVNVCLGVVFGHVAVSMSQDAFDLQIRGTGSMEASEGGMTAPMRGGLGEAEIRYNRVNGMLAVPVISQAAAGVPADDGAASTGEPAEQIRLDLGVDGDDPVPASTGLGAAPQIVSLTVIGKRRKP